jgi:hypothetical protein
MMRLGTDWKNIPGNPGFTAQGTGELAENAAGTGGLNNEAIPKSQSR